jgi:hypothetical protein
VVLRWSLKTVDMTPTVRIGNIDAGNKSVTRNKSDVGKNGAGLRLISVSKLVRTASTTVGELSTPVGVMMGVIGATANA